MPSLADASLLILGHGSTQNADSSTPTLHHALQIQKRRIFHEVHVAFWKEEPNFRAALRSIHTPLTFIVPNFISSGYFTEQIIPRELSLTPPITHTPPHTLAYCTPVGLHPSLTDALLHRANEVTAPHPPPPNQTALFIVGHGTNLNENSTQIIHQQVQTIRQRTSFAQVQAAFMEEPPFIQDWHTLTQQPNVIVVPFFISDGLHSYEDIPVLLGITHNARSQPFSTPHTIHNRRLWYARAIGTDPLIPDIILASVQSFLQQHPQILHTQTNPHPTPNPQHTYLASRTFPYTLGPITIHKQHHHYHITPAHPHPNLQTLNAPTTEDLILLLINLLKTAPDGSYRFLTTSPQIPNHWKTPPLTLDDLITTLRFILPNALTDRILYETKSLPITPLKQTTARQTGMYRRTPQATQKQIQATYQSLCLAHCGKIPLWHTPHTPIAPSQIPCNEACNAFIGQLQKTMHHDSHAPQSNTPATTPVAS